MQVVNEADEKQVVRLRRGEEPLLSFSWTQGVLKTPNNNNNNPVQKYDFRLG